MLSNPLFYTELKNDQLISSIKEVKGQIIYDRYNSRVYIDTYNIGRILTTKVIICDIMDDRGEENILYYNIFDNKFFVFNTHSNTYNEVQYLTEIIHIIEPIKKYRATSLIIPIKDSNNTIREEHAAPVTMTNIVYRPSGENLEVYLQGLLNESKDTGRYNIMIVDKDTSNPLPISTPTDNWFVVGGSMAIYIDGVFIDQNRYDINILENTVSFSDFPDGFPVGTKIEFCYFDTLNNIKINKQKFISERDQIIFKLDFIYTIGMNSVEVYINGIKQPVSSYIESSPTSITLKSTIPEGSEVFIQAGKLVPSEPEFYDDFESKIIYPIIDNKRITKYHRGKDGSVRILEEHFDEQERVILKIAKVNNIIVKQERINYNDDGSIVIIAE